MDPNISFVEYDFSPATCGQTTCHCDLCDNSVFGPAALMRPRWPMKRCDPWKNRWCQQNVKIDFKTNPSILLMAEILHHLGCIKKTP